MSKISVSLENTIFAENVLLNLGLFLNRKLSCRPLKRNLKPNKTVSKLLICCISCEFVIMAI